MPHQISYKARNGHTHVWNIPDLTVKSTTLLLRTVATQALRPATELSEADVIDIVNLVMQKRTQAGLDSLAKDKLLALACVIPEGRP